MPNHKKAPHKAGQFLRLNEPPIPEEEASTLCAEQRRQAMRRSSAQSHGLTRDPAQFVAAPMPRR